MRALRATPFARLAGLAAALAMIFAASPAIAEPADPAEERERAEEGREEREEKGRRRHLRARQGLLEMISPRAGERFAAGETVTLAWREGAAFSGARGRIEEWEAFLSLDGGGRYPIRLTPHLDAGLRSFAIRLPDQPTRNARLLIRLGDERRELELELPWTFEIAEAGVPIPAAGVRSMRSGEPAREGEPGVIAWIEGDRDGQKLRAVEAPPRDPSWRSVETSALLELPPVVPAAATPDPPAGALLTHPESGMKALHRPPLAEAPPASFEPRTQTCRINE